MRTGNKVATHEHLAELNTKSIGDMVAASSNCLTQWRARDWQGLMQALKEFSRIQDENHLLAEPTKELIDQIQIFSGVDLVRGCGALGADTALVFCSTHRMNDLRGELMAEGIKVISSSDHLDVGATAEIKFSPNHSEQKRADL